MSARVVLLNPGLPKISWHAETCHDPWHKGGEHVTYSNIYMDIQQPIYVAVDKGLEQEGIEFAYLTQKLFVLNGENSLKTPPCKPFNGIAANQRCR